MDYFVADNGNQRGPFTLEDLGRQGLAPQTLVWREGLPAWVPAGEVEELRPLLTASAAPGHMAPPPPPMPYAPPGRVDLSQVGSTRVAAGVCGLLLGGLGVHKFILGQTVPGIIVLLVTLLTCGVGGIVTSTIGIIEGIIYLTKSDAEFHQIYMVQKKPWF